MNLRTMPTTFKELDALMGDRLSLTIGNNTVARRFSTDDHIMITLHGHLIVELSSGSDEAVRVRHCGYVTRTTQDRINRFLPRYWVCNIRQSEMMVRNIDHEYEGITCFVRRVEWTPWLMDVSKGLVPRSDTL